MDVGHLILAAIGGNAAILAVLGFLAKSVFNTLLTRDIKRFEIELKGKSDTEIARLKNELDMAKLEHQVIFSKLHEKRAEVIAELYKLLAIANWEAMSLFSPRQVSEESHRAKYPDWGLKYFEFIHFLDQHRIYLPQQLSESLLSFSFKLSGPALKLGNYMYIENPDQSTLDEMNRALAEGWDAIQGDILKARQELEKEFRKILGVTAPVSSTGDSIDTISLD